MRGAISYHRNVRKTFGELLAVLAALLTVLWFFFLLAAFTCGHDILSCTQVWTIEAVLGIIVLGMWVGVFALSRRKRIGDERSDS